MAFLSKNATDSITSGSGGSYFSPSKVPDGGSVRFALLSDKPLEFFECWGSHPDAEKDKPFRFDYQPTNEDLIAEMGDYTPRDRRDSPGTPDVKLTIAVPIWNHDEGEVQVLTVSQPSLLREFDSISQMEDYMDDLTAIDFELSRTGQAKKTRYALRPVPRRKGTTPAINTAWNDAEEAGFDINRLLTGGNPFKAE
jgi:hypothetical protein